MKSIVSAAIYLCVICMLARQHVAMKPELDVNQTGDLIDDLDLANTNPRAKSEFSGISDAGNILPSAIPDQMIQKDFKKDEGDISSNHLTEIQNKPAPIRRRIADAPWVMNIGPGVGRGANKAYTVTWSNSSTTKETKEHLKKNYPYSWNQFDPDEKSKKRYTKLINPIFGSKSKSNTLPGLANQPENKNPFDENIDGIKTGSKLDDINPRNNLGRIHHHRKANQNSIVMNPMISGSLIDDTDNLMGRESLSISHDPFISPVGSHNIDKQILF